MSNRVAFHIPVKVPDPKLERWNAIWGWLTNNVGELDEHWDYSVATIHPKEPKFYTIYFRDATPAMLFKLTWAGGV